MKTRVKQALLVGILDIRGVDATTDDLYPPHISRRRSDGGRWDLEANRSHKPLPSSFYMTCHSLLSLRDDFVCLRIYSTSLVFAFSLGVLPTCARGQQFLRELFDRGTSGRHGDQKRLSGRITGSRLHYWLRIPDSMGSSEANEEEQESSPKHVHLHAMG